MWSNKIEKLLNDQRTDDSLPSYAFPGGYPVFYLDNENSILCATCATKDREDEFHTIIEYDINYEDDGMYCEECNCKIESAYGEYLELSAGEALGIVWGELHMENDE